MRRLLPFVLIVLCLAACTREADRARPSAEPAGTVATADSSTLVAADTAAQSLAARDTTEAEPLEQDPAKLAALNMALDTLEAFVGVLERIEGPINAWNQAAEAARLLRYLEQNQPAFAMEEPENAAAQRYPEQVARLNRLEARREAELRRIGEDRVAAQVLVEEMAKANAEAAGR
ncbi:MAG: hypothetical protein AAGI91_14515 [Bacteroidota bacterium]